MHQGKAHIVGVSLYEALPRFLRMRLAAPALAAGMRPGQFFLAGADAEVVRQPLFPVALEADGLTVLLPADSPFGLLGPQMSVDYVGPLGKGFPLPTASLNLLLVAQAVGFGVSEKQNGVSFLLPLIDQALDARKNIVLIHEAATAAQLFPLSALPAGVEVRLATQDGSLGHTGMAIDLLPELAQWADQVYAVGRAAWYQQVMAVLRTHRLHVSAAWAWGLLAPETMPCGLGVCDACTVDIGHSYRLACIDGPVFDLREF